MARTTLQLQFAIAACTAGVAVASLFAAGGATPLPIIGSLGVVGGLVGLLTVARQTQLDAADCRRSLDRLIVSAMPDELIVGALRARVSVIAAGLGLPVLKPWQGTLLDEPAWVWTFASSDNAGPGGMLILTQQDLARLIANDDAEQDAAIRRAFFEPGDRTVEDVWEELSREVLLAAAWAFRQGVGDALTGVAKYASIQTRELGAAPKTADGIDVARERRFTQVELEPLVRASRISRTLHFVEAFAAPAIVSGKGARVLSA